MLVARGQTDEALVEMLTGRRAGDCLRYGHACEGAGLRLLPHVRTLPRLLEDAGYRTALAGEWKAGPAEQFNWSAPPDRVEEAAGLWFVVDRAGGVSAERAAERGWRVLPMAGARLQPVELFTLVLAWCGVELPAYGSGAAGRNWTWIV